MLELFQFVYSRRKCRRELQEKHAEFSSRAQDRHGTQKSIEHGFFQSGRTLNFACSIGLCALLQIWRQQFRDCRVKRKELMQFHVEREPIRRGGAPALNHSQIRHGIKRRVHLDHLKLLRVPTKPLIRAHSFGIPMLNKTRIRPAGRSDENFAAFFLPEGSFRHPSTKSQRRRTQTRLSFSTRLSDEHTFFDLRRINIETILKMRGGAAW